MRWRCLPKDPRGPARRGRGGGRGGRRESRVDRYGEFELEAEERMGNFGDRFDVGTVLPGRQTLGRRRSGECSSFSIVASL